MFHGLVMWFSDLRGIGFIRPLPPELANGGMDIFVHYSGIDSVGYRSLKKGSIVAFDVSSRAGKPIAVGVRAVGDLAPEAGSVSNGKN
jgi:CspA family cold shock protein